MKIVLGVVGVQGNGVYHFNELLENASVDVVMLSVYWVLTPAAFEIIESQNRSALTA